LPSTPHPLPPGAQPPHSIPPRTRKEFLNCHVDFRPVGPDYFQIMIYNGYDSELRFSARNQLFFSFPPDASARMSPLPLGPASPRTYFSVFVPKAYVPVAPPPTCIAWMVISLPL
jgi:hypothetical protein